MRRSLPWIFTITSFFALLFFFSDTTPVQGDTASHIVISEIQVGGVNADDEFVELYNPTASSVDLTGWKLKYQSGNLVASMSGTIPAHGYFLVTSLGYQGAVSGDATYSASSSALTANSTVTLSDPGSDTVDKIGMGTAADKENTATPALTSGQSVERKANSSSTIASMTSGVDMLLGNGEDTDNNASDFIIRDTPEPQNSTSSLEPTSTPSPTSSITPSPTETPSITPSISPTETPTVTPSITVTPTESPTPTETPTVTPSPTVSVSPSPTMTPIPTITLPPMPTIPVFTPFHIQCTTTYLPFTVWNITIQLPQIACSVVSS